MKHMVEYRLQDGGSVIIEVDEPEIGGTVRAGRGDAIVTAQGTLEEALDRVLPVAKSAVEKLRSAATPDEIEITFGVKLTVNIGAVIASSTAEANFDVTLRWTEKARESAHGKE